MRSTEGQLVKVVQDSTQRLLARMDAHALESYNLAVDAHNQAQVAAACFTRNNIPHIAPLLPRKNSAGALPPTGGCRCAVLAQGMQCVTSGTSCCQLHS